MRALATLKVAGLVALTALCSQRATAQFEKGDNVLGVGLGVGGGYDVGWKGNGVTQSPAFVFHFDHGMGDMGPGTWGLGGYVGFKTVKYDDRYLNYWNYDYRYTFLVIGGRFTWHWNEWHGVDKLDTYAGAMLAYKSVTFKDHTDYGPYGNLNTYRYSGSGVDLGVFVGARYWFSDKFGAFGELGYGITWIQLGLSIKL
ncbi:MAG TPA: hypothetical protein VHL57_08025 [Flavobacteriales bacterium]|jgi:hypothetical protein|nr:hypothetical protein [Flavobacteriales bacterium]